MRSPVEEATPAQVGTPTQAGTLPQRRLVLQHRTVRYPSVGWYSNTDWYVTPVRKAGESAELLMINRFVKFNKTMAEVHRHAEADCS
jgi:hypothetical protein